MKRRSMLSLLLLGGLSASCGAVVVTGEAAREVYVAPLGSADAALGAVIVDRAITVYVCGGPTRFATVSQWFEGHLDGEGVASWALDGATLRVQRTAAELHVTLRMSDVGALDLEAPRVPDGDVAGLYDARDDGGRVGVIALPTAAGQELDVVGAWRAQIGLASQVTPIRPLTRSRRALRVSVHRAVMLRELWVMPVMPAR